MAFTKTKLSREKIRDLWIALQIIRTFDLPPKFRYAIKKNVDKIAPEIKATEEAYPEPPFMEYQREKAKSEKIRKKEDRAKAIEALTEKFPEADQLEQKHKDWQAEIQPHLEEEIEIELYQTPIVDEIDDINLPEGPQRNAQNQAIIDALEPILLPPSI